MTASSWLDVRLGLRMMRKCPGVSLVIVFALAVGIPVSLLPNHLVAAAMGQDPPFDEGERVVGVIGMGQAGRSELHVGDYELLRERLTTIAWLGAAIPVTVNVISRDGWSEGEDAALLTASLFTLSRVPPMLGRPLLAADEVPGAPDVAVIGHDFWRGRLGGAPDVIGSTLRVAGVQTTIVGVMPDGFAMPSTQQIWLPLRVRAADAGNRLGPSVRMYGRLADGVSLAQARAELRAVSLPAVAGVRPTPVRPEAVRFSTVEIEEPEGAGMRLLLTIAQVVPVVILLIACGNAAILILARTATRVGEVAVRTVLGASRARIMGQLFVESLVLALVATGIGLIALDVAVARLAPRFTLPFWFDPGITRAFAVKAIAVAALCAVVSGVLPALRVTGRTLQRSLQLVSAGGVGLGLGRIASALIVVEVGLAIVAMFAGGMTWLMFQPAPDADTWAPGGNRYLVASIRIEEPPPGQPTARPAGQDAGDRRVRVAALQQEIGRRLTSDPGVRGWAFSDQPPGEEADERLVRVDGDPIPRTGVASFVDPAFFTVLGVPIVAGRRFDAADVSLDPAAEPTAVIVNLTFLERRGMDPRRAIGARIRFTDVADREPGPWKEIVGVVPNIEARENRADIDGTPAVFLPATPGAVNPMTLTIDLGRDPGAFASRLRSLAAEVDPTAFVSDVYALDNLPRELNIFVIAIGVMIGLSLLAIALSATALYALMSMTVAQRKREFGIRLALGGSAGGVMITVARRALVQIALGVAWGAGLWVAIMSWAVPRALAGGLAETIAMWPFVLAAAAVLVIAIALAASLGPTLKYVRMRPVETLRVDG